MKRTLFFIACMLASVMMQAQEASNSYIPFVNKAKKWQVVRSDFGGGYHFEQYVLWDEGVVMAGKSYMRMYRSEDVLAVVYDEGLLREEDCKIYRYDTDMQKEFLVFDYALNTGDTFETYSYDEQKEVSYKVLSVSDFQEGPEVVGYDNDEHADSMVVQHRYLRQWKVCRTDDSALQKTWIEGVGSLEGPLANLYDSRPVSPRSSLAYVEYCDEKYLFLPFSFHTDYIHGGNLPTGEADYSEGGHHQLTYELEGNRLHVYGKAFTQCGPNNYAIFFEQDTDDPLVRKIRFAIQEVEPLADCMALHATDFYVPGFDPNMSYIVVDSNDKEHPVVNKTPQMAYRPFVEDGKVWKVGFIGSGNSVQLVEYYYFDGDTFIDGKTCKQMMRQRYASPDYENVLQPSLSDVGAWYEEDQKVYTYDTTRKEFQLMYDFSLDANDTLLINNQFYLIGPKQTGGLKGFKGVYRDVINHMAWKTTWLEGVGGLYGPTTNIYPGKLDPAYCLMSCTIGDEVIYLNDQYEDGDTPEVLGARKQRFDFTHTTKPRPKAPAYRGAGGQQAGTSAEMQTLYGEYDEKLLGIYLDPLDEAYLVRITDENAKVVYEKAINASSIVALNIDISTYAKGRYTVTVENSGESFTGYFDSRTTGIETVGERKETVRSSIYNLQGQRIATLQKGLNIVNGQKIYVK